MATVLAISDGITKSVSESSTVRVPFEGTAGGSPGGLYLEDDSDGVQSVFVNGAGFWLYNVYVRVVGGTSPVVAQFEIANSTGTGNDAVARQTLEVPASSLVSVNLSGIAYGQSSFPATFKRSLFVTTSAGGPINLSQRRATVSAAGG